MVGLEFAEMWTVLPAKKEQEIDLFFLSFGAKTCMAMESRVCEMKDAELELEIYWG